MPGRGYVLTLDRAEQLGAGRKAFEIVASNSSTSGHVVIKPPQLRKAQRAGNVSEAIIVAKFDHLVGPLCGDLPGACTARNAVIAKEAQACGEGRVVRRDHPSLAGRDVFNRVKAEG